MWPARIWHVMAFTGSEEVSDADKKIPVTNTFGATYSI